MDYLTIFDTFVHEKRVCSHNLTYLKHVVIYMLHMVFNISIVNNTGIHISL